MRSRLPDGTFSRVKYPFASETAFIFFIWTVTPSTGSLLVFKILPLSVPTP
ncbi:MAG: hypothetical protein HZC48_01335 [Nitrospirae bacterium]|nr:hypothetical protein [Nitrospirota bacterium]